MNQVIPGGLLGNIPVLFLVELGILGMEWESTGNEPGMTQENIENLTTPIFLVHSWSIPGIPGIPCGFPRNPPGIGGGSVKSSNHLSWMVVECCSNKAFMSVAI